MDNNNKLTLLKLKEYKDRICEYYVHPAKRIILFTVSGIELLLAIGIGVLLGNLLSVFGGKFSFALFFFGFLSIILFANILFLYLFLNKDGKYDERGINKSELGAHGTAKPMTGEEIQEAFNIQKISEANNLIYGKLSPDSDEVLTYKPRPNSTRFKAIIGKTGSAKSVSQIIPDVLMAIERGESFFCTDTKGKLYDELAPYAMKKDYIVKLFNVKDMAHSDACRLFVKNNCDIVEAQTFVSAIYDAAKKSSVSKSKDFWELSETNLLCATVLLFSHDSRRSVTSKSLAGVYDFLSQDGKNIDAAFKALSKYHPAKACANIYLQAEHLKTSAIQGVTNILQLYQDLLVRYVTSHDDIDLELPAKEKCAYFVVIDDSASTFETISAMFFRLAFRTMMNYADSRPSKEADIPFLFFLDEFTNLGYIPDFIKIHSTIRSRGGSIIIAFQGIPYLEELYGPKLAATILENCDAQILVGTNDSSGTGRFFEMQSGNMTIINESKNMDTGITTESLTGRPTYYADEVRRLKSDEQLVVVTGYNALKCYKNYYYKMPHYDELELTDINKHTPVWWNSYIEELKKRRLYIDNGDDETEKSTNDTSQTDNIITDENGNKIDTSTGEIIEEAKPKKKKTKLVYTPVSNQLTLDLEAGSDTSQKIENNRPKNF